MPLISNVRRLKEMTNLSRLHPILFVVAGLAVGSAQSACVPEGSASDQHDCALRQLTLQDNATEYLYELLLEAVAQEEKLKLQAEQNAWLEGREARCEKIAQRSAKTQFLAKDQQIGCLISLSEQRSELLQKRLTR